MTPNYGSAGLRFPFTAFDFKRRSHPAAAFAEMFATIQSELRKGGQLAEAAKLFKGGEFLTKEDARTIAALQKAGISCAEFKVGSLAPELGPGLALMYDAALEVLRSSERSIRPDSFRPSSPAFLAALVGSMVPAVGGASVTALEMASKDSAFRDRLRDRVYEIPGVMELKPLPPPNGECEHCVVVIKKNGEPDEIYCPNEEECGAFFGWLLLIFLIMGLIKLIDWIF